MPLTPDTMTNFEFVSVAYRLRAFMDTDKKQHSGTGNDKELKNAKRNNVTGVKTSDVRRDNDKPVTPQDASVTTH
jgi:hypothetical protein